MSPSTTPKKADGKSLSKRLREWRNLEAAWAHVRANGLRSESPQTRNEIRAFERTASTSLRSIQLRLRKGTFVFLPAQGLLIKKPGKTTKRPIVIAPVESRIVQRAILELTQDIPAIAAELNAGFNFGGVSGERSGVPAAVASAIQAARDKGYYIRTDIQSFFTAVPRNRAVELVKAQIDDASFADFFEKATETELADAVKFGTDVRLFPLFEEGVAQGSCLSPMVCNILLAKFDREMNVRGVTCIRYIDDFILFAKDSRSAFLAFDSAKEKLSELGLSVYDPRVAGDLLKGKTNHGPTTDTFAFLGCEISPISVRPSRDRHRALLASVAAIFRDAIVAMRQPVANTGQFDSNATYAGAMAAAGKLIRSWGNTYGFCSDDQLMTSLDHELSQLQKQFGIDCTKVLRRLSELERRRALGLFCLQDCNKDDSPNSARSIARSPLSVATTVSLITDRSDGN